jgi:hypothetical protein
MRQLRNLLILAPLALPCALTSQSTYTDPNGLFTVQVPAGWRTDFDPTIHQLTVSNGSLLAIFVVSPQNRTNAMTAKEFIDVTADEFATQCPTSRIAQKGDVPLAGTPGNYALFTCSDPKSPAVAETSAALTSTPTLIALTTISPLSRYYDSLPILDSIRDSLRLTGQPVPPTPNPKALALTELKKACTVGAFTQEDCARRIAIFISSDSNPIPTQPNSADIYRDGQNRFTVKIPNGWQATAEGDNGSAGVQLRSGSSFVNIMSAPPATSTDEVVLHQDQKIAAQSNSGRQPPFSPTGIIQLFANSLEISYDHFTASTPQGDPVESYIGGVGDISAKGPTFLLLIASLRPGHTADAGATFLATAQSIHLTPH